MGLLDGPLGPVVKDLVRTFGTPATYYRIEEGEYDTTTRKKSIIETFAPVSVQIGAFRASEVRGNIKSSDLSVMIARLDTGLVTLALAEPRLTDRLTIGGIKYEVVEIADKIYTGEQIGAFILACRK